MTMKLTTFAAVLGSIARRGAHGSTSLSIGSYIEDFDESCDRVIEANRFYGDCCSFSDINEGGKKCRLTIAGEGNGCGRNNKQYMSSCMEVGDCVAGPYVSVMYDGRVPFEECPESQYDWQAPATSSTSPPLPSVRSADPTMYDVNYEATEACPDGIITATVTDADGQPVAGTNVGFLLSGEGQYGGQITTNFNGQAIFRFTADRMDAGVTLWCNIAVDDPSLPGADQQVPCHMSVCDMPALVVEEEQPTAPAACSAGVGGQLNFQCDGTGQFHYCDGTESLAVYSCPLGTMCQCGSELTSSAPCGSASSPSSCDAPKFY